MIIVVIEIDSRRLKFVKWRFLGSQFHINGTKEVPNWYHICLFLYKIYFSKRIPFYN